METAVPYRPVPIEDAADADAGAARELEILVRSSIPIVVIQTREEARVLRLIAGLATRLAETHTPTFQWSVTGGLKRIDVTLGGALLRSEDGSEPVDVLKHILAVDKPGVYVLLDFHPYLQDPRHVRLIKDIAQEYERTARTLVFVSHALATPPELEHLVARLEIAFPAEQERRTIVDDVVEEWQRSSRRRANVERGAVERLVHNLSGLSAENVRRLARKAVFDDGALGADDVRRVLAEKHALLARGGVLQYEHDTARFADVGGLAGLKRWLEQRRPAFAGGAPDLDPPKGVLLLGVQGCGKSLASRACAGLFGVPLLKLDAGALYDKWHGESERNLRETLAVADAMAPCVLWIDEIEKAFATGDGDSGTSRRLLGAFLTWLADRRSRVFVAATANAIDSLPPELIRKGRFDEVFFVDLPTPEVRVEILRIHAKKRGLALSDAELRGLAAESEGYSGAELEQAIVAARYHAHAQGRPPGAAHVLYELRATRPLSMVMAEQVGALRSWAAERTVPAG
jgi:hypothetical protein